MKALYRCLVALAVVGGVAACDDDFDRVSEVKTVRVFAVRKSKTLAQPGDTITHTILWHDGRPNRTRPVTITWVGGCHNPPGDSFFGCFEQLEQNFEGAVTGDQFELTLPEDIVSSRPENADSDQRFGTSFVFFAACAGDLRIEETPPPDALPLGCFDEVGNRLGAEDFVLGYTQNTVFEADDPNRPTNKDPIILGYRVNGIDTPVDCLNEDCIAEEDLEPIDCTTGDPRCISACPADADEDECPEIRIEPIVDPASAELEPTDTDTDGNVQYEQGWVEYFADRGRIGSELRLISGADDGFRSEFSSQFYAPAAPGPVVVWAVAKDSRGGTAWVRLRLQIY